MVVGDRKEPTTQSIKYQDVIAWLVRWIGTLIKPQLINQKTSIYTSWLK